MLQVRASLAKAISLKRYTAHLVVVEYQTDEKRFMTVKEEESASSHMQNAAPDGRLYCHWSSSC